MSGGREAQGGNSACKRETQGDKEFVMLISFDGD
jgi:hypothetical protein